MDLRGGQFTAGAKFAWADMGVFRVRRRSCVITGRSLGMGAVMPPAKRVIRVGPAWIAVLMVLWGLAMIVPAALPH